MKRLIFLLLALALVVGLAGASTVTLTGTCYSGVVDQPNNYILFNLTNSGNGTATNLVITPLIDGAAPNNTTITLPFVAPGSTYSEHIYVWNFTTAGSYVERFLVRYNQGTNVFTTVFPCLADFLQGAQSMLAITRLGESGNNAQINISNIANYSINSQITVYAPPSFVVVPPSKNVTINGNGRATASFVINPPAFTNAEFPVAIGVSYIKDGVHYATLAITTITFAGTPSISKLPQLGSTLLVILLIAAILIIIILIIISIIMNRRKKRRQAPIPMQ
jgi:hypothetical protein